MNIGVSYRAVCCEAECNSFNVFLWNYLFLCFFVYRVFSRHFLMNIGVSCRAVCCEAECNSFNVFDGTIYLCIFRLSIFHFAFLYKY